MTALPLPKQLNEFETNLGDSEVIAMCPIITGTSDTFVTCGSNGVLGAYTYFQNIFSKLAHILSLDIEPVKMIAEIYHQNSQTRLILSRDKKYCYMHGQESTTKEFAHKINIATNEIVWASAHGSVIPNVPSVIAIDNDENVIVSSSGSGAKTELLNGGTGVSMYNSTLLDFKQIVVDSSGYIYGVQGSARDDFGVNVYKLNSDLTVSTSSYPQDTAAGQHMFSCALNDAEDVLFVCGETGDVTDVSLWALDPSDLSIIGSSTILGVQTSLSIPRMVIMSDGSLRIIASDPASNLIMRNITYSAGTFSEVVTGVWPVSSIAHNWTDIYKGPLNYLFVTINSTPPSIRVFTKDGVLVQDVDIQQSVYGLVFPNTKKSIYMNQTMEPENQPTAPAASMDFTELDDIDMCCFLSDEIPRFDNTDTYVEDDVFWIEGQGIDTDSNNSFYNNIQTRGTFRVTVGFDAEELWEIQNKIVRISRAVPCQSANWDQYKGFGGYGNCPKLYTLSLFGLLISNDGGASPYNGNYILKRISGMFGAFAAYDPVTNLQLNFNINSQPLPAPIVDSGSTTHTTGHLTKIRAYVKPPEAKNNIDILYGGLAPDRVTIIGDYTGSYIAGGTIEVEDSNEPLNDGVYNIVSVSYAVGITSIWVANGNFHATSYGGTVETVPLPQLVFQVDIVNSNAGDPPSDPGNPFAFSHDASPSSVANELTSSVGGEDNIAYNGIVSLFPGRIEEWDNTTLFADEVIVVHEGKVFQAQQANQDEEPDTTGADTTYWTILTGPGTYA